LNSFFTGVKRMSRKNFFAAIALNALCLSAVAAPGTTTGAVTVYDATQLALGSYTVVERVGMHGWRSAFGVPGHASEEAARNAVLARATQAGADGVINLKCMSQTDGVFRPSGYYCYANAIRVINR
jgi:hypothetical protein